MQFKKVAVSIAVAIYSAGASHTAGIDSQLKQQHTLQAPNITFAEVKALSQEIHQGDASSMLQNDGLNVQLNAQSKKFKEEGLDGEHIYIVRLRHSVNWHCI